MNDIRLDGRVAIVTGGGRGLGRAYAQLLARRGARVVVNDIGTSMVGQGVADGVAQAAVDEISQQGGDAIADMHDISDPGGAKALIDFALNRYGHIDIVVNNAGIIQRAPLENVTSEALGQTLKVNLMGTLYVTQAAWPHFVAQGYGRVVNATSATGLLGNIGSSSYAASKGGIIGLTRVFALEGAAHNIGVNAIAPLALTRMTESLAQADWLPTDLPADKVAPVVAWLAHEDCQVTGEVYSAGGGRVARYFTGLTDGYYSHDLTPEQVRDHLQSIRSRQNYSVPQGPEGEFAVLARQVADGNRSSGDSHPHGTEALASNTGTDKD
ncbi:MAG: SDR family NAD(P)-dependent oxidoreductase [Hyphomicrobiales bacterium]|nr:MAG: SDR family NAD(P)-dependent oxidoreductase [Hyphomicrobiales bacterium]